MSVPLLKDVEVICSWSVENSRNIEDTLTISYCMDSECALENIVNYETCAHLLGNNESHVCELTLKPNSEKDLQIVQISLVSEARVIELYGKYGEYLTTTHADFVDEFQDMSVYMARLKLSEPASECSIKLVRPKKSNQIWIYGINVTVEKIEPTKKTDSTVNFEHVNQMLKESGHQLTDKAEKCKKFLQLYSSMLDPSKIATKSPDPQMLMKMLGSAYLPQGHRFEEQARNVSKCLTDLLPGFSISSKCKSGEINKLADEAGKDMATLKTTQLDNSDTNNLKQYIDQSLIRLEERLMRKVDEKLQELEMKQSEKLDLILKQLKSLHAVNQNST